MKQVFLIVFDSVRPDHLSCYGYPRKTTPNIDKIAERGCLFRDAIVPYPILPGTARSAYAILSGQTKIMRLDDRCSQELKLLQQITPNSCFASNHLLFFSTLKWHKGWTFTYLMEAHPHFFRPGQELMDWVKTVLPAEKPALTLLWFNETHASYHYDESWQEFYADDMPSPIEMEEIALYDPGLLRENGGKPDLRKHMAYCDASIHKVDNLAQMIVERASNEVLVMAMSDHGDFLGEYGHWFTHNWTHAGSRFSREDLTEATNQCLRPIFLTMSEPSPYTEEQVSLLDIAPTVAEWLDIDPLPFWEGKSLL